MGKRVASVAGMDIGIVDADSGMAKSDFAGTGRRQRYFIHLQYVRSAVFVNPDRACRFCHRSPLRWPSNLEGDVEPVHHAITIHELDLLPADDEIVAVFGQAVQKGAAE